MVSAGTATKVLRGIRQRLSMAAGDALFAVGLGAGRHRARPGARIIAYHGLDERGGSGFNTRFISHQYFERQVAYFAGHFNVVSLAEFFRGEFDAERFTVSLTFDDGYAGTLQYALPILEKYRVPAAFFITGIRDAGMDILWPDFLDLASTMTSVPLGIDGKIFRKNWSGHYCLGSTTLKAMCKDRDYAFIEKALAAFPADCDFRSAAELEVYWRQMTVEEIRRLSGSQWATIGSHGLYHTSLGCIDCGAACEEMRRSKAFLEDVTGTEVCAIAYPDGSYNRELVAVAERLGYRYQLAVELRYPEDRDDPRLRERLGNDPFISWNNQLACILRGKY